MAQLWPGRGGQEIDYISAPPSAAYCERFPRKLAILGSTGSIGVNALQVAAALPDKLDVCGLAAGRNIELLARQALRHRPEYLAVLTRELAAELRRLLPAGYNPRILWGPEGYVEMASLEQADCVLSAQVGAAGLAGTLAAALAGKPIALANKESLVLGGDLLRSICARTGAAILPVDSEHYAIFQCLAGRGQEASQLLLTASGGPFRGQTRDALKKMRAADALRHPNWNMGRKITIDSATLMNKGLEVIEAMRLYGVALERIEVLVHPQSIVHSLVRFADDSLLAQMSEPDMRLPIAGCLLWPEVIPACQKRLDLAETGSLTFQRPDLEAFPCLGLALEAAGREAPGRWRELGINPSCVALNAANEAAVDLFLAGKCGFCDIPDLIGKALAKLSAPEMPEPDLAGEGALALAGAIGRLDGLARGEVARLAG